MSKTGHINSNILTEIEERLIKEGIIFKKRILSMNKKDKSNIINKNNSIKNMKKIFSIKIPDQNISNNETFNQSIMIPIDTQRKKRLYYKKLSNLSMTDRNNESNEKINSYMNSKFKFHQKLNIKSPKIMLDLANKENMKFNGILSPRIPKIIFQNRDLTQSQVKKIPLDNNNIKNYDKKCHNKKYNKIIINNIFGTNKEKENDMNCTNINYNYKLRQSNKTKNKVKSNGIPKSKNNIKKRNNIPNYSKQITHFALKKGNNNYNKMHHNNNSFILGFVSPRNNNEVIDSAIKKYYKSSNKKKELTESNISINSRKNSKTIFEKFNIKKNGQYKIQNNSKISLKHNINNNNFKIKNFNNFNNLDKNQNNENNLKQNIYDQTFMAQEIKIKNSKLIDYIKKSQPNKKDENLNTSFNNMNFNLNNTFGKYGRRRRNFSFNIYNNYRNENNPLLYSNDDSNTNNITFLSNGTIYSNKNKNERRVIFNRKIDYKKNKYNGDYMELAKLCASQEKIISDLVKNVQNLNNQICDKDLCINELNNQLYSIKYDLLNTLEKTKGKS